MIEKLLAKLEGWFEAFVLMAPNLAGALAVIVLFWFLSALVARVGRRLTGHAIRNKALAGLTGKMLRFGVFAVGCVIALHILSLEKAATTFLAGAGILGLALGFAFQDIAANFICGISMAIQRPLRIGDLVETNGVLGTVEKIELRSSVLRTPQGQHVMIPNRKIYQEVLTNLSHVAGRRIDLAVGVAYGDDLSVVKRTAIEAVEGVERSASNTTVDVVFTEFGDSSINLLVRFWIDPCGMSEFLHARSNAIVAIKRGFDDAGITIPFPIRTLDFGAGAVGGQQLSEQLTAARERLAS